MDEMNFPVESMGHDERSTQFSKGGCCDTLMANEYKDPIKVCYSVDCRNLYLNKEKSGTLQSKNQGGHSLNFINPVCFQNTGVGWWNQSDKAQTLRTPCGGDSTKANLVLIQGKNESETQNKRKYILRRLTPTECARLQGFPDWWTDGADGSDSNIYKMWGNGIALPCAADVIGRLAKELEIEP